MTIWIIDAEQWPRANLRAELIERGYDAIGFVDIASALDSLHRNPRAIILELRGQVLRTEMLQALNDIGAPILLLGGAEELTRPGFEPLRPAVTFRRPILLGDVADAVARLAPAGTPGPREM